MVLTHTTLARDIHDTHIYLDLLVGKTLDDTPLGALRSFDHTEVTRKILQCTMGG